MIEKVEGFFKKHVSLSSSFKSVRNKNMTCVNFTLKYTNIELLLMITMLKYLWVKFTDICD